MLIGETGGVDSVKPVLSSVSLKNYLTRKLIFSWVNDCAFWGRFWCKKFSNAF